MLFCIVIKIHIARIGDCEKRNEEKILFIYYSPIVISSVIVIVFNVNNYDFFRCIYISIYV